MTTLLITLALFLAAGLQARLPAMAWLGGLRLELLPALVVYGALSFPLAGALAVALGAGFVQDSLSAGPFGVSAITYGVIVVVLDWIREDVDRELPPVQMAGGALAATAASVVTCCFAGITVGGVFKILLLGGLSAVVTPLFFWALDFVRAAWRNCPP